METEERETDSLTFCRPARTGMMNLTSATRSSYRSLTIETSSELGACFSVSMWMILVIY